MKKKYNVSAKLLCYTLLILCPYLATAQSKPTSTPDTIKGVHLTSTQAQQAIADIALGDQCARENAFLLTKISAIQLRVSDRDSTIRLQHRIIEKQGNIIALPPPKCPKLWPWKLATTLLLAYILIAK